MPQSLDNRTQRDLNPLRKHLLPPPVSTTAHHKLPSGSLSTDSHRPPRALHHVLHSSTSDGGSSTSEVGSTVHRQLVSYFRSGWAFLIPYLAAYLLYAWLKWPVNPAAGGEGLVKGISESAGALPSTALSSPPSTFTLTSLVPCLLHVYWFLHALHLMLGAYALRTWWNGLALKLQLPTSSPTFHAYSRTRTSAEPRDVSKHQQGTGAPSAHLPPALRHVRHSSTSDGGSSASSEVGSALIWRFAPWLLLALLFYIPGVYLEFPADPWEHHSRVNEWASHSKVVDHSTWAKSSYFFAYSLLGHITPPLHQLKWLDIYYTACCLLLCWQYYLFGLAVGLGKQAAFIFVLLQALLFGNNIFGFYRYYGISSSLFAQLGAVSLTRLSIDAVQRRMPTSGKKNEIQPLSSLVQAPRAVLIQGASIVALLALTAFNHVQGLGIVALGILAVGVWRLIEWRRSMIGWLAMGAVGLSAATILWYPRHPVLDEFYRPWGWLTAWYGFNLFSTTSPAFDRAAQIIGLSGLINFVAGLYLLRRNHLAGWLTVMPIAALCLPFIAIPFANARAQTGAGDIIIYNRMLLGIPAGLALVLLGKKLLRIASTQFYGLDDIRCVLLKAVKPIPAIAVILLTTLAVPASAPFYNRAWNTLSIAPEDLQMRPLVARLTKPPFTVTGNKQAPRLLTTRGLGFITRASGNRQGSDFFMHRVIFPPGFPSAEGDSLVNSILSASKTEPHILLLIPPTMRLESSLSMAGFLSKHWSPQQVALDFTSALELEMIARQGGTRKNPESELHFFLFSESCTE